MEDPENLTDEEIAEKTRNENPELFALIMERYQKKLLRYARNLIGNDDRAADVVQDSFIKAFVNLQGFDVKKKFSSWIYRIAHNEALNAIKKLGKESPLPEDVDFESEENIELDYSQKEASAEIEKCLSRMPVIYSEPLSLSHIEDKSYEEISDILRLPMGTVATRISRAKILMKKICQENRKI